MAELQRPFRCRTCGEWHKTLPLSFSVKAPLAASQILAGDLEQRVVITPDQCVIDGTKFFIRGRVVIPIRELEEPFIWGVWAEISPKSFIRTQELWKIQGREHEPSYPGWLDTEMPLYGNTINLEVTVRTQVVGRRPHFEVMDVEHPLNKEQREGITLRRIEEIASFHLH